MATKTKGYCVKEAGGKLELIDIELPPLDHDDVEIEITHCGLCRTEHSMINNEWGISTYPMVPGHEGIGYIRKIGSNVTNLAIGDCVGIGWIRNSCRQCEPCSIGRENFCHSGYQGTYLGKNAGKYGKEGAEMKGCFAQTIQINNHFAFKIPSQNQPFDRNRLAEMAPLFCAGLTVFEPLCDYFRSGDSIGVIGLGGLGHLAIKFAKSMSAEVFVFSQSNSKREKSIELGASYYINTSDQNSFLFANSKLDLIIDCTPVNLSDQMDQFLSCLKPNGVYCKVGLPKKGEEMKISINPMVFNAYRICGSVVCGSVNTNRMIKVSLNSNVKTDVVILPFNEVNKAIEMLESNNNPLTSSRIVLEW